MEEQHSACNVESAGQQIETQVGVETQVAPADDKSDTGDTQQEPRKSERTRKLTDKGKELQEEKVKKLKKQFISFYEKWKSQAKAAKESLTADLPNEILQELIDGLTNSSSDLRRIYEELRQHITPDNDTRRRTDTCESSHKYNCGVINKSHTSYG